MTTMSKLRHTMPIAIAATLGALIGVFADQSIDGKVVLGFMTALLVMLVYVGHTATR